MAERPCALRGLPATSALCYLCGDHVSAESWDRDHIPPRRFYPRKLRSQSRVHLITAFTHPSCNRAYQLDEDYFFAALVPIAAAVGGTSSASYALEDLARSLARPQGIRLQQTLSPVPPNVGPQDVEGVFNSFDHRRLNRLVWKIARGLAYGVALTYVPESTEHTVVLSVRLPTEDNATTLRSFPGDTMNAFAFDHALKADASVWRVAFWTEVLVVVTHPWPGHAVHPQQP